MSDIRICPLLKDECLLEECAWYVSFSHFGADDKSGGSCCLNILGASVDSVAEGVTNKLDQEGYYES